MAKAAEEFEKETSREITDEDIERAKSLIGVEAPARNREHLATASPDAIRNFARSYGDDNPLYCEPEYARTTRWGAPIAPPMIPIAMTAPMLGDPMDPELKEKTKGLFRGIHVFVSGGSWDHYRPVCPGDTLYGFRGQESVDVKESEFAGRSVIAIRRNVYVNQRAEVVAINRMIVIHAERKKAREKGKYMAIEPASYTEEQLAEIDAIYESERPRGSDPRYWEDVEVGESLPKMVKGPLTVTDMIVFHSGGYGFGAYNVSTARIGYRNRKRIAGFYIKNAQGIPDVSQRVHWENDWARAIGNPMAYDYGVMRECWLSHLLTDWMGDDGWLWHQYDEMRMFNYMGDTQFLGGEVTGKRIEDGRHVVEIEIRATNQRDEVTAPGRAKVLLPSRERGPVVLPEPPAEVRDKAARMMARHYELLRERRG